MTEKKLKGWTVTETIGIGIVNPRGVTNATVSMITFDLEQSVKDGLTIKEAIIKELKKDPARIHKNVPAIKKFITEKHPEFKEEFDRIIVLA